MFTVSIFLQFLAAVPALASAPSLCLQGCCGQVLELPSRELSLSSGTVVALPEPRIPCCNCPDGAKFTPETTEDDAEVQKPTEDSPAVVTNRLPPFSMPVCPESCPCCDWCEPLYNHCNAIKMRPSYNTVRNIIGCDSLPENTPVCPIGKCSTNCLCRETIMKQLKEVLLVDRRQFEEDAKAEIENTKPKPPPSRLHSGYQPLVYPLPPWYAVKPPCTLDCPCGDYCQPIYDWCTGYMAAALRMPYIAARRAVGCQVHPVTTPLCDPGKCHAKCMCRESLFKRLEGIFFNATRKFDEG